MSKGNNHLKIRNYGNYRLRKKKNSKEDKGAIMIDVYGSEKAYIAVTISTSKTYKTLKGAERMMESFGYKKSKKNQRS